NVTNLPKLIRDRYAKDGGINSFGNFRWGGGADSCTIALYDRGAVAAEGGTTRVIRGAVFNKWLSLRDPQATVSRLGCPSAEERGVPSGATAQDFRRGRIYSIQPSGSYYVPSVFVQAIDAFGGEAATGLPTEDPRTSPATNTWLYQRFTRPGLTSL